MTDYRYRLTRSTHGLMSRGRLCWVMLNPSTADDHVDDPTIRRVVRFTRDHGYSDLTVVNLFAARATDPDELLHMDDPVGPRNTRAIVTAFGDADDVAFAWGAWVDRPAASHLVRLSVADYAATWGHTPLCLGVTAGGAPRHPLYVRASARLTPYVKEPVPA